MANEHIIDGAFNESLTRAAENLKAALEVAEAENKKLKKENEYLVGEFNAIRSKTLASVSDAFEGLLGDPDVSKEVKDEISHILRRLRGR